jgi:hypothetical protein
MSSTCTTQALLAASWSPLVVSAGFASVGSLGSGSDAGNDQTSLSMTTTGDIEAGHLVVVIIAFDNTVNLDQQTSNVTGIASAGQNFTKVIEWNSTDAGTETSAAVGIWYLVATSQINSGSSITASFLGTNTLVDASAMSAWEFTFTSSGIAVTGTPAFLENLAASAGSLDVTTFNVECLRIRAIGSESNSTTALTKTAAFDSVMTQAVSGAGTSSLEIGVRGEFAITTGTGLASAPTSPTADTASVYVAFRGV